MPSGLARYGFDSNPYRLQLDPPSDPIHRDWVIRVDGFSKLVDIDDLIAATANQPHPLFFLVTGKSGTGRTCVANYILARYRDQRGIAPDRFIVPEDRKARSHDEFSTFKSWLIYLLNDIDEISPIVNLPEGLLTTISSAERDTMEAVFQGIVRRISNAMAATKPLAGFGCCLEDIPTFKFISSALAIFAKAQTVCVFTAGDYEEWQREVIRPFKKTIGSDLNRIVELSPLVGEQVELLVHERWQSASQHENPHNIDQHITPFDLEGIRNAFGNKPRPIGKVLSIVARLLELKAPTYESGPPWPEAAQLRFSAEELRENVRILEEG